MASAWIQEQAVKSAMSREEMCFIWVFMSVLLKIMVLHSFRK